MRVTPSAKVLLAATVLLAVILLAGGAQAQVSDRTTGTTASIWNHNGSLMSLELAGGQLRFAYVQPRVGMIDAGARAGSPLFEGRLQAARISGLARIFVWQCGQYTYQVEGEVSNDGTHITLKGLAPWVERATCALKGSTPDVLNFDLKSGEPIAMGITSPDHRAADAGRMEVALSQSGGTFQVPVTINGAIRLAFVIDSGASDVTIPADVVMTLMRTGTISDADFLGNRTYRLADGSTVPSPTFRIRSLKVGDRILEDVTGSIAPAAGDLLLGQSFLRRFQSWSIDNGRGVLVLDWSDTPATPGSPDTSRLAPGLRSRGRPSGTIP